MTSLLTGADKDRITARIKDIIAEADIETVTVKGIRKQIEQEDGKDYTEEKQFFSQTIQEILKESIINNDNDNNNNNESVAPTLTTTKQPPVQQPIESSIDDDYQLALELQRQEKSTGMKSLRRRQASTLKKYTDGVIHISKKAKTSGDTGDEGKRKSTNRLNKPMAMSLELQALLGNRFTEISRPEAVKQIWAYIKEHNLQDPSDKRMIVGDEKFLAVFKKGRINCFAMNKVLSSHLFPLDSISFQTSRKDSIASQDTEEEVDSESEACDDNLDVPEKTNTPEPSQKMNRRLLMIPGVVEDMPLEVVQSVILNYTKTAKLRHPDDPDLVRIVPGSPVFDLLGRPIGESTINVAQLITLINVLYNEGS